MGKISTGHAKQLVYNYDKKEIGKDPAAGVWFPREVIQAVLDNEVQGIKPNGLRFYFAKYEKHEAPVERPPKYKEESEQMTLVIIPTTYRLDDEGEVIKHPYRVGEYLPFDLLTTPKQARGYDPMSKDSFDEQNDGQICPPPPPSSPPLNKKQKSKSKD